MYTPPNSNLDPAQVIRVQGQSGLGIASFIVAIVCMVVTFAIFGYAGYVEVTTEGGMSEESPVAILLGLAIMACIGFTLLGLALGIAGALQQDRHRAFAVIGIVLNGLITILIGAVIWFGVTYG